MVGWLDGSDFLAGFGWLGDRFGVFFPYFNLLVGRVVGSMAR